METRRGEWATWMYERAQVDRCGVDMFKVQRYSKGTTVMASAKNLWETVQNCAKALTS